MTVNFASSLFQLHILRCLLEQKVIRLSRQLLMHLCGTKQSQSEFRRHPEVAAAVIHPAVRRFRLQRPPATMAFGLVNARTGVASVVCRAALSD